MQGDFRIHLFLLGTFLIAIADGKQSLGFKDSLRQCLRNNFDIQMSDLTTREKAPGISRALGDFDFNLSAGYTVDHSETPSASSLDGVATATISDTKTSKLEIRKKSSWLGTDISLPYSYFPSTSNSSYARIPEGHNTSLGLSITQPLIKPFYSGYLDKKVIRAELDLKQAREKYGESLDKALIKAIQLYLEVVQSSEILRVKESSLRTSEDLFKAAQAKEAAGRASLMDKLDAQSRYHRSQESVLLAKASFEDKKQEYAMHTMAEPDSSLEVVNEIESLLKSPADLSADAVIGQALEKRPEAKAAATAVEMANLDFRNAQVDLFPTLNLEASQTRKGLAENFSDSQKQINEATYTSQTFGLKLEMPIMRYAINGEREIKSLRQSQEELRRQNVIRNIKLEVIKALRQVQIQWQRLAALEKVVNAESLKVQGQALRQKNGQISIADLNQAFQDEEGAQLEWLKGRINYIRAVYDLSKARGTLLEDLEL